MALGAPLVLSALLTAAAGPSAPSADSIPIRVDFDAPAGCSSASAFYNGVAARSDRVRRAASGETAVRFAVRLSRSGSRVHGELRLVDGQTAVDTRRVDGSACDEVVGVLSLTAALAIDPAARMGPPISAPSAGADAGGPGGTEAGAASGPSESAATPASPLPPPPPPPPPQPAPPQAAEPPPQDLTPDRGHALRFALGVQAMAARVLVPSVAVGGGISLRLMQIRPDAPPRSVELSAIYLATDALGSADGVVARWAALSVTVCPGWGLAATHLAIDLCAQGVGGSLQVTDRAVTNPAVATRFWGAVGGMARLGIPVGREFWLEAEVTLGIPLMERRFITTTPEETVGDTPVVALAGAIGIARRF
jgi:hypothetical protein